MQYGTVTGRFLATIADTLSDADPNPDVVPVTGKVRFTPSVTAVIAAQEAAIVLPTPITAELDAQGYISLNGARGVNLVATNSTGINPTDFTYTVAFVDLKYAGIALDYKSFSLKVPAGTTVDLSDVTPVPSESGVVIVRGEKGDTGPSAYDAWLALGNTGTVYDFIVSLKGEPGAGGYVKPADGIPASDLTAGVRSSLSKADSALQSAPVVSVAGRGGAVTLTKTDVGLSNVDNTADADKPISSLTATALSGKAPTTHTHTASQISDSTVTGRSLITAADASAARNTLAAAAAATTLTAGTGLTGGGDLSAGRSFGLNAASVASLAKADSASQPGHTHTASQISDSSLMGRTVLTTSDQAVARNALAVPDWGNEIIAGSGLTGGGNLTVSRTLALSAASIASLAKADTLTNALGDASRLGAISKNLSGTDLNNWKDNGWGAGNNLTNSPDGSTGFFYVRNHANINADNYFQQTGVKYALGGGSGATWVRYAEGTGVYTPWVQIADSAGGLDATARAALATKITKGQQAIVYADIDATIATAINNGAAAYSALGSKAPIASPTFTGTVSGVSKAMVGLSNVDNTADTAKPVSTAQATAIALKAPIASPTFTGTVSGVTAAMTGSVANDGAILRVKQITQSAYTALATKDANTLYVIVG